ncbi:MAG: hypothetical protein Q8S09_10680 [Hyphomonas sp.]|nr:hypothetical protein [Hyphomonas sp.]
MNPYSRFRLISNTATAALPAGLLCAVWPVASDMLATATGGLTPVYWASVAGVAAGLVLASLVLTEWVFPSLFQLGFLRRIVLGRDYVEGTWLQAERGPSGSERLTVLHVRPSGYGFGLSGFCLNQESEIESNRMIEYAKLDGPVLSYAYRSLMPDGAGNQAKGSSELMFEQRRGAPKAYSGHGDAGGGARRFQIEGVKLTKGSERRRLLRIEQRSDVVETYWALFFGTPAADDAAYEPPAVRRPVVAQAAPVVFVDRRDPESHPVEDGSVITRRRASDWRSEDATPTADRIRSRMMPEVVEEEDEVLLEDEFDEATEFDTEADGEDEMRLDDDEEGEYEAETEGTTEDEPIRIRQRYARR